MQKGCSHGQACSARGGTAAVSSSSLGLGGLGHEAICELAFLELDDSARQRVIALISTPDFLQSSNRIGPDLHRVHGEGYVEERVFERERVRRRQAKVE